VPAPHAGIRLRIYTPRPAEALPVLVYAHGGGWWFGGIDHVDRPCRDIAAGADCIVVSVDYRLAPEHKFPDPVEDVYAATMWVTEHAAEFAGDPARVVIAGDSAGANMAAAVCLMARDRHVPAAVHQILIYPVIQDRRAPADPSPQARDSAFLSSEDVRHFLDLYLRNTGDHRNPYALPGCAASLVGLPPAFVLTAEIDPLRDEGAAYAARLRAAGVPARHKDYRGVMHGFFTMADQIPRAREAVGDVIDELRRTLDGASPAPP
jgi:acetyl esterase